MYTSTSFRPGLVAGLSAGAAVLAAGALVRLALPVPTLPELVWDAAVANLPGPLFSAVLDILKYAAKPLLLIGLISLQLAASGVLGVIYAVGSSTNPSLLAHSRRRPWLAGATFGLLIGVLTLIASLVVPITGTVLTVMTASFLAFGVLQAELLARLDHTDPATGRPEMIDVVRRDLLFKGTATMVALALGGVFLRTVVSVGQQGINLARPVAAKLRSYITDNEEFYRVSKNLADPTVDESSWRLEITGQVSHPLALSFEDVKSLPSVTRVITLECISNEVGGDLMGNAVWKGVPLRDLLEKAGIAPQAVDVALFAADGYSDSIPVSKALDPAAILAYEMNGAPLAKAHGFPVRLLVSGIYGMKNLKWLTRVEPVNRDFQGFWQEQGWSDTAVVRTTSSIDVPQRGDVAGGQATIAGVAFAGDRGISRVEISLDGGLTWHQATLGKSESTHSWVLWSLDWQFAKDGPHTIIVRAVDGRGSIQESTEDDPFPNGASGHHRITVTVQRQAQN